MIKIKIVLLAVHTDGSVIKNDQKKNYAEFIPEELSSLSSYPEP